MDPKTGEIKKFPKEKAAEEKAEAKELAKPKTLHKIPEGWIGLPMPGYEVEVVVPPENKRGRTWKVVEIMEGTPGRMVLEPSLKTMNKGKKRL